MDVKKIFFAFFLISCNMLANNLSTKHIEVAFSKYKTYRFQVVTKEWLNFKGKL